MIASTSDPEQLVEFANTLVAKAFSGVYRTTDAGATWTRSDAGLPLATVKGVGVTPAADPEVFAWIDGDRPPQGLDAIERIYAHPQSFAQTAGWLRAHLPKVEKIPVSSNAEAAKRVKSEWNSAAIAGDMAAGLYGLTRLAEKIDLAASTAVQAAVRAAEQRLGDQGRVLLRASGTEPVIRVMVEGQDAVLVQALAEELAEAVRGSL